MNKCLVVLLALLTLVGCGKQVVYLDENGNEIDPPQQEETKYIYQSGDRFEIIEEISGRLDEVRDVETGVHYYHYQSTSVSGGLSLTPIYESDGSIRVSK